jgi:DNA-binding transcriptional MerR regulator
MYAGIGCKMDGPARAVIPVEFDKNQQRREDAQPGGFMFIGELAAETGVDPKTIRFYEREGLLSPPRHGRFRTYMESDVRRLKDVLMMRRLGIGIANIRKMFEASPEITKSQQTINLLLSHLETLRSRQAEVAKQLEDTSAMLLHYSSQ